MIEINDKKDCCGCNACGDVCPVRAITFVRDAGGFLYPNVDTSRCTQCGACKRACPMLRVSEMRKAAPQNDPINYAAVAKNLQIRFDSTSGGLFSVFAEHILRQGGFVGGAVWDEEFFIHQILTDDVSRLPQLRSSKYAQSDARGFFSDVKRAVLTGRPVLVCGLPCQMTAVRTFLGRDYDNLFVLDLICRTTSSPEFLREYIKYHEVLAQSRVVAIKQKDKGLGWRNLTTKLTFESGKIVYDPKYESYFMRAFEANLISRPSCYDCRFKGFPRLADITLADCWGAIDKVPKHYNLDNNIGTSLVMCNTEKGRMLYSEIEKAGQISDLEVEFEDVVKGNFGLRYPVPTPKHEPELIYSNLGKKSLPEILDPLLREPAIERSRIRQILRGAKRRVRRLLNLRRHLWSAIKINGWRNVVLGKPLLIPNGRILVQFDPGSSLEVLSDTSFSNSFVRGSSIESRIRFWPNSKLTLRGGTLGTGSYMLLFENSHLDIGPRCCININFSVTCGKSIKIGRDVFIGQNVSIRDTHGDHFINTPGYENTKPVVIGDHVWIASDALIMPGVTIGPGSIVAARSVVTKDVPAGCLVAGTPARVIRENVQFRC